MVLDFYNLMVAFLLDNTELVILGLSIIQLVKIGLQKFEWYKKWMGYIVALVVSFGMAVPSEAFDLLTFMAAGTGLFLMATGIYKLLKEMMLKVAESLEEQL